MSSTVHKAQNVFLEICIYIAILMVLLLSSININSFFVPKKVLGIRTEVENKSINEINFWNNFLLKNPNYAPGWNEIGRNDMVNQIDPNFEVKATN
ncbi:MAG TPA: hypothetical protein VKC54_00110 [Patescibacteria group bacterium]|nr:hypothetical protein [Patescibacteria group bacterium]